MPKIKLIIGKRPYEISCNAGDETRVQALAQRLDNRVNEVINNLGAVSEGMALVVSALMMEDEIKDLKAGLPSANNYADNNDQQIIDLLEPFSDRIEALANKLKVL